MVSIKSALVTLALSTTALAGVRCGSSELEAPKDQLQQCIDELHARDQELCTVPAGQLNMGFVHIGTAMITGVHNDGNTEEDTSSWCGHVADAAQEILDQCGGDKDTVSGSNEAYGNGNLSVNLIYRDEDGPDT
ncbi:hypothetical protein ASPSYDRAFT_136621 [Aspergillus sydowii CBS 593.65]|uniref:Ecp2 effector protein domain-containing protein n=1 Tax=Aspergillus sydowii CBS 593.65 TaxID=1036612 RepID=A0A1L9T2X0_9EURO|nr:uncharacterized protein ASPSYDRAFT_136621 [Aspergillus sydowii CBS 593.65]OJJ53792.1 hypothetical protein ASPSYDRAFT_136621 [Aspergillus sydowii CBS 593.65]